MIKNFFLAGWRNLSRNKVFSFLNITGLAIGITVCLVIGVWLERELSFDKFHPNKDYIYRVSNTFKSESESFSQAPSGTAFGAHLPKELPAVKSACRIFYDEFKLKYEAKQHVESPSIIVDSNFFSFFGFKLISGNPLEVLKSHDRIVLTQSLAKKYFGTENPLGKTMMLEGEYPMIVAGIAEDAPLNSQIRYGLIVPYAHLRKRAMEQWKYDIDNAWSGGWPLTYIQLDKAADPAIIEKQINQLASKRAEKEWKENKMSYVYFLQPLTDIHLKSNLRYDTRSNGSLARVRIFAVIGVIVLLLACINYINLTTAGAIKRARETSVRKVVGASKFQLIRQFFFETLVLCGIAVITGIVLLKLLLPAFSTWIGQPYHFALSGTNILIVLGFVVFISAVAGIYPAAILSSFRPAIALKGNFSQSTRGNYIRKGLVVFQFTMTIGLVASILIISRQMNYIKNKSLGFQGDAVIEVPFYGEPAVSGQYASLRDKLLASPYILNVSKHNQNVVGGLGNGWTTTKNLKGEEISTSLYNMYVDTSYFDTYNMKLVAGRFFSKEFPADTTKSLLVNEAAVRTFGWQTAENAIGKPFGKGENEQRVVGVVKDFNFESLHKPVEALMIGYSIAGNRLSLKLDGNHITEALDHLKKVWSASITEVPLSYTFINESVEKQYGNEQKMEGIFYGFAGLSLLIGCLGLFGLSLYVVERKIKEIGIRKVLGASIPGIVGLLSRDFLKLVVIAALIASPIAWWLMNEWLKDFAYRVNIGWWIFLVSGLLALTIALITVSFQSIRAALANPVKSLRTD